MIVKKPKTSYERLIYEKIVHDKSFSTEGDKSVLYDLAARYIPKYVYINWSSINLDDYINTIKRTYSKYKSTEQLNVICNCINALFNNKHAYMDGPMYEKTIVVEDISIS